MNAKREHEENIVSTVSLFLFNVVLYQYTNWKRYINDFVRGKKNINITYPTLEGLKYVCAYRYKDIIVQ